MVCVVVEGSGVGVVGLGCVTVVCVVDGGRVIIMGVGFVASFGIQLCPPSSFTHSSFSAQCFIFSSILDPLISYPVQRLIYRRLCCFRLHLLVFIVYQS